MKYENEVFSCVDFLLRMERSKNLSQDKIRDEKVKLMQERQKQWMQQRQTASKRNDVEPKHSSMKSSSRSEKKTHSRGGKTNEVLLWTAKNPEAVNEGFVVRKQSGRSEKGKEDIGSARSSKSIASSRTVRSGTGLDTSKKGLRPKTDSKFGEKHATSTPEERYQNKDFGVDIAKDLSSINIASYEEHMSKPVKDIGYDKSNYASYDNKISHMADQIGQSMSSYSQQSQESYSNPRMDEQKTNTKFSMHCCPLCKKLMHQQTNLPFLIIPCGHNVCAQCQPGLSTCPTCNAKIASAVENVTLSHVIKEYKKQEEREELARKEKEARKYVEEYDSLKTRCDVLSCKAEDAIEVMEQITSELVKTKTNMKSIEERKVDLRMKIEELQEELSNCEADYEENEQVCKELESSYSKQKDNFDLIENTLDRIKEGKERVKTLVLSFIPTFRFDDD